MALIKLNSNGLATGVDGKLDKTGSWYKHIKAVKDANSKE